MVDQMQMRVGADPTMIDAREGRIELTRTSEFSWRVARFPYGHFGATGVISVDETRAMPWAVTPISPLYEAQTFAGWGDAFLFATGIASRQS